MQVAADLLELDELRRLAGERLLAQLRRDERKAERGEDAPLVTGVRQRTQCLDVCRRAGRPDELRAETRRLGDDELDRDPFHGHAERAPLVPVDDGDDLRQGAECVERGSRL